VQYQVKLEGDRLTARAIVTLRNEAPDRGLPPYVIGNAVKPPMPTGTTRTYLSVYSPWGLDGASVNGRATSLESQVELGRNVYSAYVDVPPGATVVVEVELSGVRAAGLPEYVLDLHRQPVVGDDDVQELLCDPACRTTEVSLARDRRLSWPLAVRPG
jgi:hypothetical protein